MRRLHRWARSLHGRGTQRVGKWPSIRKDVVPSTDPMEGIRAALAWLFRSQDVNDDGGSSAYFSVETRRWAPSYPETTGYIINTLIGALVALDLDEATRREIETRARRMADWLVSLQMPDGAFPAGLAGDPDPQPRLFNTGQVLSGLVTLGIRSSDETVLEAARRAADWMCDIQNDDGSWDRYLYDRNCRTYYAHALKALAFAALQKEFPNGARYAQAARRFVDWALPHQRENGWTDRASLFTPEMKSEYYVLHTIAYTIDGFLGLGVSLNHEPCVEAGLRGAEALMRRFEIDGVLWAEYDERWRPIANYICVTGGAQMASIWARSYQLTNDVRFLNAMLKMSDCLRAIQPRGDAPADIQGGFPGSIPIHAKYQPNQWPNWAAKFALDAFLNEVDLLKSLDGVDCHPEPGLWLWNDPDEPEGKFLR